MHRKKFILVAHNDMHRKFYIEQNKISSHAFDMSGNFQMHLSAQSPLNISNIFVSYEPMQDFGTL
jgi:hypothetical protein